MDSTTPTTSDPGWWLDAAQDAISDAQHALNQGLMVTAARCLERALAALKAGTYE